MVGALLQLAKRDTARFAGKDWNVEVVLTTPDGTISLNVTGLATGTWWRLDDSQDGKTVNSRSNSFSVPESQLIAGNYPYKNAKGKVVLKQHKIMLNDGAAMSGSYVINEQHPNQTLGLIVCTLGIMEN